MSTRSLAALPRIAPFAAVGLALVLPAAASAAVLEIPVPSLVRYYSGAVPQFGYFAQDTTLAIPGGPAVIHSVSVRIHGTSEVGTFHCIDGGSHPWTTCMSIYVGGQFVGAQASWCNGTVPGTLSATYVFTLPSGKSWAGLTTSGTQVPLSTIAAADNQAYAGFYCSPDLPTPSWSLDECTLLVDGDFPVPTSPYSWGRLKAAYR